MSQAGIWQVNSTPAYGEFGAWVSYPEAAGGGGGPGGTGANNAINRVFPSPNSRLWTTYAGRVFPVP